ncbi:gas vesicle protein GvpG, partial [Streptomyces avermitilis]|uniref:gas vesicle protein GvpG n=1 Tax=Streptomyces avermitilis TaxID=33903 RepID=UPI0033BA2101
MGLIGEALLLPFAPARGSIWVLGQVLAEAERQYYDPATIRVDLLGLDHLVLEVRVGRVDTGVQDGDLD